MYAVHAYVTEVQNALPDSTKLPSYQYGAQGCYLFFEAKLKDLGGYEELHSGVFHSFRRLGNCLALLSLLESAVHSRAVTGLHQMPPRGKPATVTLAATAVSAAWGQSAEESDLVLMGEQMAALAQPLSFGMSCSNASLAPHQQRQRCKRGPSTIPLLGCVCWRKILPIQQHWQSPPSLTPRLVPI